MCLLQDTRVTYLGSAYNGNLFDTYLCTRVFWAFDHVNNLYGISFTHYFIRLAHVAPLCSRRLSISQLQFMVTLQVE